MKYSALIVDVIDSRKYNDRYIVQELLKVSIDYLNKKFSESIIKNVMISGGDEIQGLFKTNTAAFLYYRKLQLLLFPIKIRGGLGRGSIKYNNENWISTEIDGAAYYNARKAITSIPDKGSNVIFYNSENEENKYLNMLLLSNSEIKNRQSNTVKTIELLLDIIYPIINKDDNINYLEDSFFYKQLLELKYNISNNKLLSSSINKYESSITYSKIFLPEIIFNNIEPCYYDYSEKDKLFIDDFWKKGFSTIIAEVLDTSRQNIDKHIALGKIKESRNLDGTILLILGREENDVL